MMAAREITAVTGVVLIGAWLGMKRTLECDYDRIALVIWLRSHVCAIRCWPSQAFWMWSFL
jgi:hypothetical protein